MKTLPKIFLLLFFCGAVVSLADDQELAPSRWLPSVGAEWTLKDQGSFTEKGASYQGAWATFVNAETGDILAFAMERYPGIKCDVGGSATKQSSQDMFPGGYPRFAKKEFSPTGWEAYFVRCHVINLGTGVLPGKPNHDFDALEFTYIYDHDDRKSPKRMGHGYAMAFEDTIYYVQQTSTHIITDEDVQSMAIELARARLDRDPRQGHLR